jgi:hypothetical protein
MCVSCKAICVMHNPCVCISQLTLIWNVGMKSILFLWLSCPPSPETSCLPCLGFATCVRVFKPCKWSACPMPLLVWWGCWKLCVYHISENFLFEAREVLSIFPTHLHSFPFVENVVYWTSNWWPKFVWVWNFCTSIHSSAFILSLLLWFLDIIAVEISLQFPRFVPVTLYIQVPSHWQWAFKDIIRMWETPTNYSVCLPFYALSLDVYF